MCCDYSSFIRMKNSIIWLPSTLFMINRCCEGGDLLSKICSQTKFTEYDICHIMRQVLSAIHYCHQMHVVHRDLKPENILFTDDDTNMIKVIDFGRSKIIKSKEKINELAGTVY